MDKKEQPKKQPDIVFVPLVCIGYLPPRTRRILELRAAKLTDEQIKQILEQEATYALN